MPRPRFIVPAGQGERFYEAVMSALVQGGGLDPPLGEAHRVRPIARALCLDHQPLAGGQQTAPKALPLSCHPVAVVLSANVVRSEEEVALPPRDGLAFAPSGEIRLERREVDPDG